MVTSKDNPARKIDAPYNHYNLLATLEAAYGVDCLGHACEAKGALIDGLFEYCEATTGAAPPRFPDSGINTSWAEAERPPQLKSGAIQRTRVKCSYFP